MAQVRFAGVQKRFGRATVVERLDLTVNDGEFFTFVGPSGCGKSTILNMIAGLEDISEGLIFFGERAVNRLSPRERDVAMVFQNYALYPHMTVFDNIAFPLRMRKQANDVILREVERVAGILGLRDKLRSKPAQLSGGERQRVAFGRAIVRRPTVFLMDEPLSNLDAQLRLQMRAELKKLHADLSVTTIYVTHDQTEAMGLSDRIAVLNAGMVQQVGTPSEIYLRPENVFVAGFMGMPPMNFVSARVRSSEPPQIDVNGITCDFDVPMAPGTAITVGIRPEDVRVTAGRGTGMAEAVVSVVEPAGSFSWVDVSWNGVVVKGVAGADADYRPGLEVSIDFDHRKILLFEPKGKRINSAPL